MNVLVIGSFPAETAERIRGAFPAEWGVHAAARAAAEAYLPAAEVIIPEHVTVDTAMLAKAPRLRMVQTGAGYDNVDLAACSARGIIVCNGAGVNANAVAEHTLAMILARYKNLPYLDAGMKAHSPESTLNYHGGEIRGKTIGLIGCGAIGQRVAALCRAFGLEVLVYSRSGTAPEGGKAVPLDTLLRESDIVSLHIPANAETRHLINAETLAKMKPGAILVNTARGSLVDEAALAAALEQGTIAGACLDVFEQEPLPQASRLRELPNVILTPHTAGLPDGVKYHRQRYTFFAANIRRLEQGERPMNEVNG